MVRGPLCDIQRQANALMRAAVSKLLQVHD